MHKNFLIVGFLIALIASPVAHATSEYDLAHAICCGDEDKVSRFLEGAADVNVKFKPTDKTALMIAIDEYAQQINKTDHAVGQGMLRGVAKFGSGIAMAGFGSVLTILKLRSVASLNKAGIKQARDSAWQGTQEERSKGRRELGEKLGFFANLKLFLTEIKYMIEDIFNQIWESNSLEQSPEEAEEEEQINRAMKDATQQAIEKLVRQGEQPPGDAQAGTALAGQTGGLLGGLVGGDTVREFSAPINAMASDVSRVCNTVTVIGGTSDAPKTIKEVGKLARTMHTETQLAIAAASAVVAYRGLKRAWQGGSEAIKPFRYYSPGGEKAKLVARKNIITRLLNCRDLELDTRDSKGQSALDTIHKHMGQHLKDPEKYKYLAEIEQLIKSRRMIDGAA